MTESDEVIDRIIAGLKADAEADLSAQRQSSVDAIDQTRSDELAANRARQFVDELRELAAQMGPRLGPELGRPIPVQIESVINPFHGTHHDFRTGIRVLQHEIHVSACQGTVSVEFRDVATGNRESRLMIEGSDLMPSQRHETIGRTLAALLQRSLRQR